MLRRALLIVAFVVLAGCTSGARSGPAESDSGQGHYKSSLDAWHKARFAEGRAIYNRACASCHDPGAGIAPAIGVQQDWDNRSRMWTAVLTEHANSGYLGMPAKGGVPHLSDKEVGAAAEYILTVTYPELPVD